MFVLVFNLFYAFLGCKLTDDMFAKLCAALTEMRRFNVLTLKSLILFSCMELNKIFCADNNLTDKSLNLLTSVVRMQAANLTIFQISGIYDIPF